MKISLMITKLSYGAKNNLWGKNNNKRSITWKSKKGGTIILVCDTCFDLIHIQIKLNADIINGYRVMECIRMFGAIP